MAQGVLHLATRIPPPDSQGDPEAWGENDRLRRNATRTLVDVLRAPRRADPRRGTSSLTDPGVSALTGLLVSAARREEDQSHVTDHGHRLPRNRRRDRR